MVAAAGLGELFGGRRRRRRGSTASRDPEGYLRALELLASTCGRTKCRVRGHRGRGRVGQGGRAALWSPSLGTLASERLAPGGRASRRDRRRFAPAPARMTGDRAPRRVGGDAREHAGGVRARDRARRRLRRVRRPGAGDGWLVVCHDRRPPDGGEGPLLAPAQELASSASPHSPRWSTCARGGSA